MSNLLKLSTLFVIFLLNCQVNGDTLKSLFVVHRHGDRTPVVLFPNDPYANESLYWPDGFGQLTSAGKKRMYNIGVFLREKYDTFLGDSIRDIQIRSSDKDRCLESAQLVVNGAFKPQGRWIWEPNQAWIPVPIHTYPNYMDSMLYPSSTCSAAYEEAAKIENSNYVKSINKKYENLYKYLTLNAGQQINDIVHASYLYDNLKIEQAHGYQIPVWATDKVLEELKDLNVISFITMGLTRRIQKLRSGVLLNDLAEKIKMLVKKPTPKKKLLVDDAKKLNVYSTHDSFLAVLLEALQINNKLPPPFGSTVIFELHQNNESGANWDESSSIKIFYFNETEKNDPYLMKIPACQDTDICTIKQFISSISDLLLSPQAWIKECKKSLVKETLKLTSGNRSIISENFVEQLH